MSEQEPNFEGHQNRECGEHRTVGSHRAWCYECSEWCYPRSDGGCKGCMLPALEEKADQFRMHLDTVNCFTDKQLKEVRAKSVAHGERLATERIIKQIREQYNYWLYGEGGKAMYMDGEHSLKIPLWVLHQLADSLESGGKP